MSDKNKLHYIENRLWELIDKRDTIWPHLLDDLIKEMAEDIVHYIKKG